MPRGPTLGDIAAKAGVNKSTASKALHPQPDRYPISSALREKVRRAAAELGWDPDPRRRAAARERTGIVSLLFAHHQWFTLGEWSDLAGLISGRLFEVGYRLAYAPVMDGLAAWKQGMHHHTCDAAILTDPLPDHLEVAESLGLPLVVFNQLTSLAVPHVVPDEDDAQKQLIRHLCELGHRRIAYARIDAKGGHWSGPARRTAFLRQCAERGISAVLCEDIGGELESRLRHLLEVDRVTAIVGYCHVDAILILQTLWRMGTKVPDQVSLVSTDRTWYTSWTCPALTCLELPTRAMASLAVDLAMAGINGRQAPGRMVHQLPGTLHVDASSGPPPRR